MATDSAAPVRVAAIGAATAKSSIRIIALLIGSITLVCFGYFYQGGGWNPNSRFDLLRAILDQHTLRIDAYHENTQDKAVYQGHYYSDKAPGLVLMAVPVAAALRPLLRVPGLDPQSLDGLVATAYLATVVVVALPTSLACIALFLIAWKLGSGLSGAVFAALAMGLATPVWPWATLLWSHALSGALLLFGFGCAVMLPDAASPRGRALWGLALGLAAGWATVTEYPAAPAAAILALFGLAQVWRDHRVAPWQTAAGIALGAAICLSVLLGYQRLAFGSALRPSYSYYGQGAFPWMQRGYMGLTYPRIDVAFKLLFGCKRGLILAAPVLGAAPFGLRMLARNPASRSAALAAGAIAVYFLLFNASFAVWTGSASYGPRYMGACVPVLCVALAPVWDRAQHRLRLLLAVLAGCGALFSLMAAATTPHPGETISCPLWQLIGPSFFTGQLSLTTTSVLTPAEEGLTHAHGAFNLGQLAGLRGLASLGPLLLFLAAATWGLARVYRASNPPPRAVSSSVG